MGAGAGYTTLGAVMRGLLIAGLACGRNMRLNKHRPLPAPCCSVPYRAVPFYTVLYRAILPGCVV